MKNDCKHCLHKDTNPDTGSDSILAQERANNQLIEIREKSWNPQLTGNDSEKLHYLFGKMISLFEWRCKHGTRIDLTKPTDCTRAEVFAGLTLGIKKIDKTMIDGPYSIFLPSHDKSLVGESSKYRFNTRYLTTRDIPFDDLGKKLPSGFYRSQFRLLVSEAETFLRNLLDGEDLSNAYLQCNINAYKSTDRMAWHRDDVSIYVGEKQFPQTNTFFPAVVTAILLDRKLSENTKSEKAGFKLCISDFSSKEIAPADVKNVDHCIVAGGGEGKLVGLAGAAYRYGLHQAATGWDAPGQNNTFQRISLNFRFVRPEARLAFLAAQELPPNGMSGSEAQ